MKLSADAGTHLWIDIHVHIQEAQSSRETEWN